MCLILRDARKSALLRMRVSTLMVRSAAPPRVSNHEAKPSQAWLEDHSFGRIFSISASLGRKSEPFWYTESTMMPLPSFSAVLPTKAPSVD
jgi:hypothetical protein